MKEESKKFLKELTTWSAVISFIIWLITILNKNLDTAYWFMLSTGFLVIIRILLGDKSWE